MINKKIKLLELEYDYAKSWLFSLIAIEVILSVTKMNITNKYLDWSLVIIGLACIVFFIILDINYKKLRKTLIK